VADTNPEDTKEPVAVKLEPIVRRTFPQEDRATVQERVASEVERAPEFFLARYVEDPRSLGGRFVNSDLMKETFEDYSRSNETRNRYNAPVHNAAAVLAAEQYRRIVSDRSDLARDVALFLTGIPGAGKTTFALGGGSLPIHVRVLYEGQLANAGQAIEKIEQALGAGLRPEITVVHLPAEEALRNTLQRFETEGRGASIEAMASIQGRLPDGLRAVQERFGEAVNLRLVPRPRE
jgi:Zeta toxin